MPAVLNALVAFVAEHQRCGDPDGGRDNGYVWLTCSCGAQNSVTAPPVHLAESTNNWSIVK